MTYNIKTTTDEQLSNSQHILATVSGDVLLVGGYGAGNIGDEAILSGLLRNVSSEIETLSVVSHNPKETRQLHESTVPESITFNPIEPSVGGLTSHLVTNKHIIIGGGGIFSRYMGPYAEKIPYFAIAAQALQLSVHWTAIGVYPSTPDSVMTPLRFAMKRSSSVTVRDPISLETLNEHGISSAQLIPDPATMLSPKIAAGKQTLEDAGINPNERVVGIAARRVMDETSNARLQQTYRDVAEHFIGNGWTVAFVPFCRHPYEEVEQDDEVCVEIASEYESAEIISYEHPEELLGVVSELDAMVATRLHSMIFAYTANIPFAAIEYAAKCTSLLDHYGMADRGVTLKNATADPVIEILSEQLQEQH